MGSVPVQTERGSMPGDTQHRSRTWTSGMWMALFLAWFGGLWVPANHLAAQVGPSPDPTPLVIVLTRLDRGDVAAAERLMSENLPVTKQRLEAVIAEFDEKFDELG